MTARSGIGAMRARLRLEAPVDMPDDTGAFTRTWTPVARLWGAIETGRGDQRFTASRIETDFSHEVTIRWRRDVANGMRFLFEGRVLMIKAVADPDQRRRILV